jgi:subtilisin-like proprotein convertase family protein
MPQANPTVPHRGRTGLIARASVRSAILAVLLIVLGLPASGQTVTFSNSTFTTLNDSSSPPTKAQSYPLNITVSGMANPTQVTVTLNGLWHPRPEDLDIALVSPAGTRLKLMSDVGGTSQTSNATFTFDDNASQTIINSIFSSSYRVSDASTSPTDSFPTPGPSNFNATTLSAFNGANPNGTWSLYIVDDTAGPASGTKTISGWSLNLSVPPANDDFANAEVVASAVTAGENIGATAEIGEPRGDSPRIARRTVWYDWTAPTTSEIVIETGLNTFDTTLGVYTGASVGALTQVAFNDERPGQTWNESGLIMPTVSGTVYHLQIDGYSASDSGSFELYLKNPVTPTITSGTTASATVGVTATYAILADDYPSSYTATGVPPGMTLNTATGVITGAPTAVGTYPMSVSAINSAGSDSQTVTVTVVMLPPVITSAQTATIAVGTTFAYDIVATGGPTAYGAAPRPAWLSVNPATGRLSGTPTTVGTYSVGLTATNGGGTGTSILTITVNGSATSTTRFASSATDTSTCGFGAGTAFLMLVVGLTFRRAR